MKRAPALPVQPGKPDPHLGSELMEAQIVSQQPGTNLVDVRVGRMGHRVLRKVRVSHGTTYQAGDFVLIARTYTGQGWVCVVKIQDPDQYGLDQATSQAGNELHPPSGFTVYAANSLIIAEWGGWAGGADVCYLCRHNSSEKDENATDFITRGSYCVYKTTVATTRYFRVRSLRYDVTEDEAYYSAWTIWKNATSSPISTAVLHAGLLQYMHQRDWVWTQHIRGEFQ